MTDKLNIGSSDDLKSIDNEEKVKRLYETVKHVDVQTFTPGKRFVFNAANLPNPSESVIQRVIAEIVSEQDRCYEEAITKAVQRYARENGRTELVIIPEELLFKILKLGTIALIKEESNES